MTSLASYLFSTPQGAFFMGSFLTLGLISSLFSLGFFSVLRHKSLLFFAMAVLFAYPAFAFMNQDPQQVYDMGANFMAIRIINFSFALSFYFYYRLIISVFTPFPSLRYFPSIIFHWILTLNLIMRMIVIMTLNSYLIRLSSIAAVLFFISTTIFTFAYSSPKKSTRLIKIGSYILCGGLMIYPLMRSGLLPLTPTKAFVPILIVSTLSIFSTFWLLGLIALAQEASENAENISLRNIARAFIQLRDLINTPLQAIEFSVSLLQDEKTDHKTNLGYIESALSQMRKINEALFQYEKSVDWSQKDDFLNINQTSDKKSKK